MSKERITSELHRIATVIEQITGLHSRWNGSVELIPDATFKGKKPFSCIILLDAGLIDADGRWRTLIHESLHAFSAGYTRNDYAQYVGWEEGVVEQFQRLLRSEVLAALGIVVAEEVFQELEKDHAYNGYIAALEAIREAMGIENKEFYLGLLRVPIRDRYTSLVGHVLQQSDPTRARLLRILAASKRVLEGKSL